jgi:hypothetical protein
MTTAPHAWTLDALLAVARTCALPPGPPSLWVRRGGVQSVLCPPVENGRRIVHPLLALKTTPRTLLVVAVEAGAWVEVPMDHHPVLQWLAC